MIERIRSGVRGARRDDGLTLIELLVAMGLFAVLLAIVGGTFYSITRATTFAVARDQNSRNASNAMNEIVRQVRAAADNPRTGASDSPAFISAGTSAVQFTTLVATGRDAVPQQVTFSVSAAGVLTETIVAGSTTDNAYFTFSGSGSTSTIASSIELPASGGTPIFQYLDGNSVALTPNAAGVLTADQIGQIAFVQVTLRLSSSASTLKNGITLQNTVGLPNLLQPTGDST
ncbi:prepilin-type N-terminal cleavage/methylation domain-containing protein [Curtobacterium pusillum]|uniref:Prepilin-type N-terminal cleavage/methylation domain-containing protein n=1 Tax=Curtobacterium pusillum TaxID=69373 RepID=A0AAW3T062_9MICO|nr:prepilin-type N-terminal cleavage/methylation domain-containing protein [Curtobacterium pusillum]MBA8989129.1 prepilin-type N-terminal cleavage/methylation domain-containing protein [Curtobacterium pusillum]